MLSAVTFFLSHTATLLRIARAEVRSCRGRIGVLCGSGKRQSGEWYLTSILDLGPMFEDGPDEHLQLCRDSLARSEGIVKISAKYPWASAGDALLFLEGWEAARQWERGKADTLCKEKAESR